MAVELDHWVEQIRGGEARPLARALTEIENRGHAPTPSLRHCFRIPARPCESG